MPTDLNNLPVNHRASQPAWYAIYTRHQHEKSVARFLTSRGFDIFLPLYATARRWKDRTKLLSLPLFPCYVFIEGGLERRLDIVSAPGANGLVSSSGQPAAIPCGEIEAIRRAVDSGAQVEPHPLIKCGDRVTVKCGALEGIQGILVRKRNLCRLILSVGMLGRAVAVEVDTLTIERTIGDRPAVSSVRTKPSVVLPHVRVPFQWVI